MTDQPKLSTAPDGTLMRESASGLVLPAKGLMLPPTATPTKPTVSATSEQLEEAKSRMADVAKLEAQQAMARREVAAARKLALMPDRAEAIRILVAATDCDPDIAKKVLRNAEKAIRRGTPSTTHTQPAPTPINRQQARKIQRQMAKRG